MYIDARWYQHFEANVRQDSKVTPHITFSKRRSTETIALYQNDQTQQFVASECISKDMCALSYTHGTPCFAVMRRSNTDRIKIGQTLQIQYFVASE